MAKKKRLKKEEVKRDSPAPAPEQVIVIHFTKGVPRMETNGDLQVWHFMTAQALLEQVVLQDVVLGAFQRVQVLNALNRKGNQD